MGANSLLVLNAGSSSLKFKLFSIAPFAACMSGLIERIGDTVNSTLVARGASKGSNSTSSWKEKVPIKDHVVAMERIMRFLGDNVSPNIEADVAAVGHRIVHGLDIHKAVLLTDDVIARVRTAATLAPLHNPPGLQGLQAAQLVFKRVPQVGVFDTAFHQTMPPEAYMYATPWEWYSAHHVRRYGFHGTSHKYLAETATALLGREALGTNLISCHLGNGSSITAIRDGMSVDTSMGLTPLDGLMMGTRAGDMDPAIPMHMMRVLGVGPADMDTILNKKSGLLGVYGASDLRAVIEGAANGEERGKLALDMFVYRVAKYVGSYSAALNGPLHALIFSAGIGENSALIRRLICDRLQGLGIRLDAAANEAAVGGRQGDISGLGSSTKVLVVPTDEELSIAQQTLEVVRETGQGAAGAA